MTVTRLPTPAELSPTVAWSQRVRKVGGLIQLALAAFWLLRGGLSISGPTGTALAAAGVVLAVVVLVYAIRVSTGIGGRPTLDHVVHIPRLRPVGWALTVVPFILVAVMSSSSLAATTGLGAGILLLCTATAGFRDLAALRALAE